MDLIKVILQILFGSLFWLGLGAIPIVISYIINSMFPLNNNLKIILFIILNVSFWIYCGYQMFCKETKINQNCDTNSSNNIQKENINSKQLLENRKINLILMNFNNITKNMSKEIIEQHKQDLTYYSEALMYENKEMLKEYYKNGTKEDYDKLIDDFHIREEKRLKNHVSYEGRIGVRDKRILKEKLGYTCQACGLKMSEKYGDIGANYIELHHKVPYSQLQENDNRLLNVNDFCVLCPNCHRMIHKLENAGDIELLKEILKSES